MIGAPIPQDILKYEAKLVGNFTARQTIIYGAGLSLAAMIDLKILPSYVPKEIKFYVAAAILIVFFAWGNVKPFGQPLEKVIIPILQDNFLKPAVRVKAYDRAEHEKEFNKPLKSSDIKDRAKKSKTIKCY